MSHTYAELAVSPEAYEEIAVKLKAAGYDHAFIQDDDHEQPTLDMDGIGLIVETDS